MSTSSSLPAWATLAGGVDQRVRNARRGRPRPARLAFTDSDRCRNGGSIVPPAMGIGNAPGRLRVLASVPDELRRAIDELAPGAGASTTLVALAAWAASEIRRRRIRVVVFAAD